MLRISCEQVEALQAKLDDWLTHLYGECAAHMRPWFDVSQASYEAELGVNDLMRLILGLIKCPHCAFHFDVHPNRSAGLETTYTVYVEPAVVRTE